MSEICPNCHVPLPEDYVRSTPYWHTFSAVLASALRKFAHGVGRKGENNIHLRQDLNGALHLSKDEYGNFSKLRVHGLVAHVKINGHLKKGYWLLTRRGSRFLKSKESIARSVRTQNNEVKGHSEERIMITDLAGLPPIDLSFEISDGDTYIPTPQGRLFEPRPAFIN